MTKKNKSKKTFSWMNPKLEVRNTKKIYLSKKIVSSKRCLDCMGCCIFDDKDAYLAPHLSKKETELIERCFLEKDKNFYKIKLERYKKNKKLLKCCFLKENDHRCLIYRKRPMECKIWPLVIGKGEKSGSVYLYVVNSDWCPAAVKNKFKNKDIIKDMCRFIKGKGFIDEIKRGERYVWPVENYYIKIKKLI
jgi:Fe-S-cluster containining protein